MGVIKAQPATAFIREKFTKERTAARKHVKEYFQRFPKERYQTEAIGTPSGALRSRSGCERMRLGLR